MHASDFSADSPWIFGLENALVLWMTHCYKTDGEIPVHTHDDARRQRSKTGKYFPYESGINTCLAPEFFNTSGIFPRYTA
jgi:hypothetical protein